MQQDGTPQDKFMYHVPENFGSNMINGVGRVSKGSAFQGEFFALIP